jgi:hypothetical protein
MSILTLNSFSQFQQTEQEQLVGTTLNTEQKQFIQTQLAKIAEQRLALTPDPLNYSVFIQQEAHLKGQMDFAKYLLDCSESSEAAVKELIAAQNQ